MEHSVTTLSATSLSPTSLSATISPLLEPVAQVMRVDARERGSRDLACRHLAGVSTLLNARFDLRGVHAWADIVEESVRWSA